MNRIKNLLIDFLYIFYNYFVLNIPSWHIRKILYLIGGMKINKGARICMKVTITKPWKVSIGCNSIINEYCHIDSRGGVFIENNVSISIYTIILTGSHYSTSDTFEYYEKEVLIKRNVWVGARSIILPGVTLEEGCLIGAGSTVKRGVYNKDGFYSGVPAVFIRNRELKGLYEQKWNPYFR